MHLPGDVKTVVATPLDAFPDLLPLLADTVGDSPLPCCSSCSASLIQNQREPPR